MCLTVCVFKRRCFSSVDASSGIIGHDDSEPNRCALQLEFILSANKISII